MPFVDVFGKTGTAPLPQIVRLVPKLNVGVALGRTVTVIVRDKPHVPVAGENVYVPVF